MLESNKEEEEEAHLLTRPCPQPASKTTHWGIRLVERRALGVLEGDGFTVYGLRFRVHESEFSVQGLGSRA